MKSTNKKLAFTEGDIDKVVDGKIVERAPDAAAFLQAAFLPRNAKDLGNYFCFAKTAYLYSNANFAEYKYAVLMLYSIILTIGKIFQKSFYRKRS